MMLLEFPEVIFAQWWALKYNHCSLEILLPLVMSLNNFSWKWPPWHLISNSGDMVPLCCYGQYWCLLLQLWHKKGLGSESMCVWDRLSRFWFPWWLEILRQPSSRLAPFHYPWCRVPSPKARQGQWMLCRIFWGAPIYITTPVGPIFLSVFAYPALSSVGQCPLSVYTVQRAIGLQRLVMLCHCPAW